MSEDEYDGGIEIPLCPQNRERSVCKEARGMSGESGLPAGHFSSLNTPDAGLSQRRTAQGTREAHLSSGSLELLCVRPPTV